MISRLLLVLAVALTLGLSGCGDGASPEAEPSPTESASSTESTGSTGSDGSAGSAESSEATIAPADGPLVDRGVFTYRLPAEVEWDLDLDDTFALHRDEAGNKFVISVSDITKQAGSPMTLDYAADLSLSNTVIYDPPLERGADRTVDGVEGWTAETVDKAFGELVYRFGTVHAGRYIDLTITGPKRDPRTREWIEAVLASVEWR